MSNRSLRFIFIAVAFFLCFVCFSIPTQAADVASLLNSFFPKSVVAEQHEPFSEEQLAALIKPSIVRIISKNKGEIRINTNFELDLKNFKIKPLPVKKPITLPLEATLTGTGFIVSPNGYIVSNAHVVSDKSLEYEALNKFTLIILDQYVRALSTTDQKVLATTINTSAGATTFAQFVKDIRKNLIDHTTSTVVATTTVLKPTSTANNLNDLISLGYPAKVIRVNNNYIFDQKDVGVLKINTDNLPALPLTIHNASTSIGQKMYVFGFPVNADVSQKLGSDFLTPTFTGGNISAYKDSVNGDFKIIETDSKISSGSSGSPVLDAAGNVLGVLTYGTADATKSNGDSFSFAIPLSVVLPQLSDAGVIASPGNLYTYFDEGLTYKEDKHCASAIESFTKAKDSNPDFPVGNFIDKYIDECRALQLAGQSLDSSWDSLRLNLQKYKITLLLIGGGIFVFVLVLLVAVWLFRKLRKDEQRIEDLTKTHVLDATPVKTELPEIPPAASPQLQSRVDDVASFIKEHRAQKATDGSIVLALRSKGYADAEIQQAFAIVNRPN